MGWQNIFSISTSDFELKAPSSVLPKKRLLILIAAESKQRNSEVAYQTCIKKLDLACMKSLKSNIAADVQFCAMQGCLVYFHLTGCRYEVWMKCVGAAISGDVYETCNSYILKGIGRLSPSMFLRVYCINEERENREYRVYNIFRNMLNRPVKNKAGTYSSFKVGHEFIFRTKLCCNKFLCFISMGQEITGLMVVFMVVS